MLSTKIKLIAASVLAVASITVYGEVAGNDITQGLIKAAKERTLHKVAYDGSYFSISYPNGDVPDNVGVCTDVVIRSFRQVGVDLQQKVHEDMVKHFDAYPSKKLWNLTTTDKNIDHRRVPNLQVFFKRFGKDLVVTEHAKDYRPGDLVTWILPGNLPHIGIVIDEQSADGLRPLVVHNIGQGPKAEDSLFAYPVTGHYRYIGR